MPQQQEPQKLAVTASSKASPLRWMTQGNPTNYNMLLFRTMNREMGHPNANDDDLAPLLRDKLMPLRMWWLKSVPGAMKQMRGALEHKKLGVPGVVNFVDARTKWFDQQVQAALTQHGIHQVVAVAAGFDTRAYRFGARYPGAARFFEVDLPHASAKKQQLVQQLLQPEASHPRPVFIGADLSKVSLDQALLEPSYAAASTAGAAVGFDPTQPTLFTVEGLIYYLPTAAVRQLFASLLRVAAPGSRVAFDFLHKQVLEGSVPLPPAYKVTAQSVANKGEPFISGIDNNKEALAAFMAGIGSSAAAPAAAAAGTPQQQQHREFKLVQFMTPQEMAAAQLPHLQWDDKLPPMLSFYSFAAFEVL